MNVSSSFHLFSSENASKDEIMFAILVEQLGLPRAAYIADGFGWQVNFNLEAYLRPKQIRLVQQPSPESFASSDESCKNCSEQNAEQPPL
jgi:hypothetical protein